MRTRGFTLLEVLIALAILAVSAAAVLRQTQIGVQQQQRLELKTYAMWIADDEIAGLLVRPQWPAPGRSQRRINAQGLEWDVIADIQTTPDSNLRKMDISVGPADGAALVTFTTYRGQY